MTLIETLVLALIHGTARYLPIGSEAIERLFNKILGWPMSDPNWRGSFAMGSLAALLIFFIHDWASILASFIQVLFRKKPMTFDERFPIFLMLAMLLPAGGYWYVKNQMGVEVSALIADPTGLWVSAGMAAGAFLLWVGERWNRKNKGLFDLNGGDSVLFGAAQSLAFLPGINPSTGTMAISQLRNYHPEAATKLIALFSLPFIAFESMRGFEAVDWRGSEPLAGTSWFHWSLAMGITAVATYFGLRVLTDQIRRNGYGGWVAYRLVIALVLVGLYFWGPA